MSKYKGIILCLMSLSIIDSCMIYSGTQRYGERVDLRQVAHEKLLERDRELVYNAGLHINILLDVASRIPETSQGKKVINNFIEQLQNYFSGATPDICNLRRILQDSNDIHVIMNESDKQFLGNESLIDQLLDEYRAVPDPKDPVYYPSQLYDDQRVPNSNDPLYFPNAIKDLQELRDRSEKQKKALITLYMREANPLYKNMICGVLKL